MYKLTFNSGDDFFAFGDMNLGSKKIKQDDWFAVEPQTLSFMLLYYPNPESVQEILSNNIIDSIFVTGQVVKGIIRNAIFRLYYNDYLVFTGIIDKTQSSYNLGTKDCKIFCYDMLKLLSIINNDNYEIIDDSLLLNDFLSANNNQSLEYIINNYNLISDFTVNNLSTSTPMILDSPVQIITNNVMKYKSIGETYRQIFMEYNEDDKCIYIGFFHFNRGFINYGTENAEVVAVQAESGLYRLDGLTYYEVYIRTDNYIPVPDGIVNTFAWANLLQLNIGNIHRAQLKEYMTHTNEIGMEIGLPETDELIYDGLTYTYNIPQESNSASYYINITGDMFSYRHAVGKFLQDGYVESNKTSLIDVFKMFLILNNFICYAENKQLIIKSYLDYSATRIIDDDDIYEVIESYIDESGITDIPAASGNTDKLLNVLNRYYHDNISETTINIKINFSLINTIKIGDRVINNTYGIDAFVIEYKLSSKQSYIELIGVQND